MAADGDLAIPQIAILEVCQRDATSVTLDGRSIGIGTWVRNARVLFVRSEGLGVLPIAEEISVDQSSSSGHACNIDDLPLEERKMIVKSGEIHNPISDEVRLLVQGNGGPDVPLVGRNS